MDTSPYTIRLELLKMAREILSEEHYGTREQMFREHEVLCENARTSGATIPTPKAFPPFPDEDKIIAKAKKLNEFVSNKI
jgi:hypothetical protein